MKRRWDVFGRTADAVTIIAAVVTVFSLALAGPLQQVVMAVALSLLATVSVIVAWVQSKQLHHAAEMTVQNQLLSSALAPLSNAIDDFKRAYYVLSTTDAENTEPAAQAFVNRCEAACSEAAQAFGVLTGQECRVTLQELYSVDVSDGLRTAVRTIATSDRRGPTGADTVDWVDENTDFAALVAGKEYYHSDDLRVAIQEGYRNSHWTPEELREWNRSDQYPYRSTVVWPVRVRRDGQQVWHLVGFLSIDSRQVGVFDLQAVRPLVAALSSVAYTGLSLYGTIKDSQEEHTIAGKD